MSKGKIFLVGDDVETLTALKAIDYESEDVLQRLLATYPDLLAGDQINPEDPRRWLFVAREVAVPGEEAGGGRWSLDHLFLDQEAVPTFVECKRATDTRARREVVAQMLDYAANGSEYWSMERLRQAATETAERKGSSLDQEVANLLGCEEDASEVEDFWQAVEDNLRAHRVRLLFVTDATPPELRRLVEFMNEEMTRVEVLAVEVKLFEDGGSSQRALVPRVVGQTEAARALKDTSRSKKRRQWTEKSFFEAIEEENDQAAVDLARDLYDWSKAEADRVWFGTGAVTGSYTYHYLSDGKTISVFSVYTDGRLMLNMGYLDVQVDTDVLKGFQNEIGEISSFSSIDPSSNKWPALPIEDALSDEGCREAFLKAVLNVRTAIRS